MSLPSFVSVSFTLVEGTDRVNHSPYLFLCGVTLGSRMTKVP